MENYYCIRYTQNGAKIVCKVIGEAAKIRKVEELKRNGRKVQSVRKLYPFNLERNAHNLELIRNVANNRMYDMLSGDLPMDEGEYQRLADIASRALGYLLSVGPTRWLEWDAWQEVKSLSDMGIEYRAEANERAGRPDRAALCR